MSNEKLITMQFSLNLRKILENRGLTQKELAEIERKIHNGVKAMLNGMDIAEMKEEINRLKMRKIELEETIKNVPTVKTLDRNALVDYFRNIVDNWDSLDKDRMANILLTMPLVAYKAGDLGEPHTAYATINC